jgi:hypothetical protein
MSLTYNATTVNGTGAGNVINGRLGASYAIGDSKQENKKDGTPAQQSETSNSKSKTGNMKLFTKPKHSFNCNIQYTHKSAFSTNVAYSEWTINACYMMNF